MICCNLLWHKWFDKDDVEYRTTIEDLESNMQIELQLVPVLSLEEWSCFAVLKPNNKLIASSGICHKLESEAIEACLEELLNIRTLITKLNMKVRAD